MRATQHSGRMGSASHNDRSFLSRNGGRSDHIDTNRTGDNLYMSWNGDIDFRRAELDFYQKYLSAGIDAKNARYVAQRHADRCRTVEDVYANKKTMPDEIILQIGNKDQRPDPEVVTACITDFIGRQEQWARDHGDPFTILTCAIHLDEATPHAHERIVWHYIDRSGNLSIGQDKALQAAGVERPNPDRPRDRHNNRKMTYTAEMRQLWLDVLRDHGIEAERDPIPGQHHADKESYIRDQIVNDVANAQAQAQDAQIRAQEAQERTEKLQADISTLQAEKSRIDAEIAPMRNTAHVIHDLDNAKIFPVTNKYQLDRDTMDRVKSTLAAATEDRRARHKVEADNMQLQTDRDNAIARADDLYQTVQDQRWQIEQLQRDLERSERDKYKYMAYAQHASILHDSRYDRLIQIESDYWRGIMENRGDDYIKSLSAQYYEAAQQFDYRDNDDQIYIISALYDLGQREHDQGLDLGDDLTHGGR